MPKKTYLTKLQGLRILVRKYLGPGQLAHAKTTTQARALLRKNGYGKMIPADLRSRRKRLRKAYGKKRTSHKKSARHYLYSASFSDRPKHRISGSRLSRTMGRLGYKTSGRGIPKSASARRARWIKLMRGEPGMHAMCTRFKRLGGVPRNTFSCNKVVRTARRKNPHGLWDGAWFGYLMKQYQRSILSKKRKYPKSRVHYKPYLLSKNSALRRWILASKKRKSTRRRKH
jgi:hypothetical protein